MERGYVNFVLQLTPKGLINHPSRVFTREKKPEWFDDRFVKDAIKGIDGATVLFQQALMDRYGYGIPPEYLSNGCKSVILMRFIKNRIFTNEFFGENCWPYIFKLAESGVVINIAPLANVWCSEIRNADVSLARIDGKPVSSYRDIYRAADDLFEQYDKDLEAAEGV